MSGVVERIWGYDASLWTNSGEDRWLGWLDVVDRVRPRIPELNAFAEAAIEQFDDFVLLGMGGSSLAPEVLRRAFAVESFHVLDTTHPAAIRRLEGELDLERTLFVASSKSGSTIETRSHLEYFWERTGGRGAQFAAITDPGSELEQLAQERGFRATFPGEPEIGGRYSALSLFGMVPASLMGVALERFLERAAEMMEALRLEEGNPGLELGLQLGEGWQSGRDKVCIDSHPSDFGLWAEQLLAESTGKQGKGVVPAPGESPEGPDRQRGEVRLPDAVRARAGVAPLGVRDCGRRARARNQPVRPARRAGGEGQDERGSRRRRARRRTSWLARRAAGPGRRRGLRLHPGVHRPGA